MTLFNGEKFECFHCHGGTNATGSYRDWRTTADTIQYPFFNTGLYNVDGEGSYPAYDQGLYDVRIDLDLRGFFRPPSLRNVELTAPYTHDGSIPTLREMVEHYAAGGRVIEDGDYAGDGRVSPLKSGLIRGFDATDEEIDAVVAFLESFTDHTFVENPAHSDPFEE
jgi:cytochrome c peroxidase